jgi:hypothetical protein
MFSLCIPTLNRFDNFLDKNLDKYIRFLEEGLIDEIVICDENGNDYDKLNNKYREMIENTNNKFRIYKNDIVLGVFYNKIKVCNLAKNNYIILIDSDNFADRDYFINAKNFISISVMPEYFIISPSLLKTTNFNYKHLSDVVYTKKNVKQYINSYHFITMLNTGNYILSKNIFLNLNTEFSSFTADKIASCDVIYFNLLVFQQIEDIHLYVLKNLEYEHIVHNDSEYIKKNHIGNHYLDNHVIPAWKNI